MEMLCCFSYIQGNQVSVVLLAFNITRGGGEEGVEWLLGTYHWQAKVQEGKNVAGRTVHSKEIAYAVIADSS